MLPRSFLRKGRFVFAATVVALGFCGPAAAALGQNAAAQISSGVTAPGRLAADCSAYAAVPLPAEAESVPVPKTSPDCASYRSYRGIGRPVNYAEARVCAWQERLAEKAQLGQNQKEPTAWVVGGSLILADIYFNGADVPRNVPLAMRFACEFEDQTAMLALPAIEKLNGSLPAHRPFEFCDYAATTFTMDFCSGYAQQIADDRGSRYYASLRSSMTGEQRAAFARLLAAEHAYIESHAFEVYQGGSIRVMRTLGSQNILENLFHAEVVHYERKEWPALSAGQIAAADGLLQRACETTLQHLGKESEEDIRDGAVTAENFSKAERAWEGYRDAWAAFARVRHPAAEKAIRAQITLDRFRLVKTIESFE